MSANNINNLPNFDNSVNRIGSNAGSNTQASNALEKGDYDWFSEDTGGVALPITAKEQLSGTVDDMVSAIAGRLGL